MAKKTEDAIPEELRALLRWLPEATAGERDRFLELVAEFFRPAGPGEELRLPPVARVKWHLARERRLDELVEVIRYERENPGVFDVAGGTRPRAVIPELSGSLPAGVTRLRPDELPVQSRATELRWHDGKLVVRGFAFVVNVPPHGRRLLPRIGWLRQHGSRRRVPVRLKPRTESQATRDSKQALHDYDAAGFEIVIDPARLRSRGRWQTGTWQLTLALPAPGGWRRGVVGKTDIGTAGHSQARELDQGIRLVAGFPDGHLQLRIDTPPAEIDAQRCEAERLLLTIGSAARVSDGALPAALRIEQKPKRGEPQPEPVRYPLDTAPTAVDGRRQYTVAVPLQDLSVATEPDAATRDFLAHFELPDGTTRRATVREAFTPDRYPLGGGREAAVTTDGPGLLKLHDRAHQPVVDSLNWTADGTLVVSGDYAGEGAGTQMVLRHGQRFEEHTVPVSWEGPRFCARITPERVPVLDGTVPLRQGRWYLSLRAVDAWDHSSDAPVKLRSDLVDTLPLAHRGKHRTCTVNRRFFDRLFLGSGHALGTDERGARRQRLLREVETPLFKEQPLREAVFYSSFGGKQFSDSPRAVYEELVRRGADVEHVWSVSDGQVVLPDGVRGVEWHSREWYEALARSRYVITNVGLGDWFERRAGQTIVQTWHGTPLKKIGADLLGTPKANRAYIASLPQRFRQFDAVVSPNAFTTPIMRRAFRCEGEILESGYPRNDIFHRPDREEVAARVREKLGIPEGRKVVLYAPTWRDDQRHSGSKFKLDLRIDLAAAQAELGDDHVFLFRKHPKILDAVPGAGQGFVFDVSAYPDIAELYLITDVLITDYSSVLFDFAHSGRPMLFFTYDLEHYRDTLRGFYFDFTERAPGPLIKTSPELISAIRDINEVAAKHRANYAEFVRDFCAPSDGLASARVADRLLGTSTGTGTSGPPVETSVGTDTGTAER